MYILDRFQVEELLHFGGEYTKEFNDIKIVISKMNDKIRIAGTNVRSKVGFNLPNITNVNTYEEVQEIVNKNMVFMPAAVEIKTYNHLLGYKLTSK